MRLAVSVLIVAAGAAGGCGPAVTVDYTFGADLPVPPTGPVRVGPIAVAEGSPLYGPVAAEALRRRLEASPLLALAPEGKEARMTVSATLETTASDEKGDRLIRRLVEGGPRAGAVRVPTLVRKASARMVFVVTDAAGRQIASAETRRRYTSAEDPRTRGALGLYRGDDPARVPPTDAILRGLVDGCVETFWNMLQPRPVRVTVRLRPTLNPHGIRGLAAVRKGDFVQASHRFYDAVASEPRNPDLLLNQAVCAEKAHLPATALTAYEALLKLGRGHQVIARQGVRRVRRAMRQRGLLPPGE